MFSRLSIATVVFPAVLLLTLLACGPMDLEPTPDGGEASPDTGEMTHDRAEATHDAGETSPDSPREWAPERTKDSPPDAPKDSPQEKPTITVWHGLEQKVGHLGEAQDDFNLMGQVSGPAKMTSLTYSVNGGPEVKLTVGNNPNGFGDGRRLAKTGHFNADIAIKDLPQKNNEVLLRARDEKGKEATQKVTIKVEDGTYPLPVDINWQKIKDPQEVGQYVDGHWQIKDKGLRTMHTGYDRLFLIGNKTWSDYVVLVPVTIHKVDERTGPQSGGNGVGLIFYFAGHVTGGFRNFPDGQPKWGYQPFGAIGWLRWPNGAPQKPPLRQFYRGDSDRITNHGEFKITEGKTYWFKMASENLPDDKNGAGVVKYSFKTWEDGQPEPTLWDWEETQVSPHALTQGGVALVAHYVDVSFGNITIKPF